MKPTNTADTGLRFPAVLVAAIALGLSVSVAPIYLTTFSVFLPELEAEFGWSRGRLSAIFASTAFAMALASPGFGYLIMRFGARAILFVSIFFFSVSVAALAVAPNNYLVYLAMSVIVGIAGTGTNTFVWVSILPQWFSERLGLALGIAMTGIGVGLSTLTIVSQLLTTALGWRNAYLALSALPLIIALPMVIFFLRERPRLIQRPAKKDKPVRSATKLLISPTFLLLATCFFLVSVAATGTSIHGIPILRERGFSPIEAASISATSGLAVLGGRLMSGIILDFIKPRIVASVVFAGAAVGAFSFSSFAPLQMIYVAPILLGVALGAEGDLMPYSIKKFFPLEFYPAIYGWLFMMYSLGVMTGPLLLGVMYDRAGSYDGALFVLIAAALLAIPLFWIATHFAQKSVDLRDAHIAAEQKATV